jgi:hypothetical protein
MKFTRHFSEDVFPKRTYLTAEILSEILQNPIRKEYQEDGKIKIWGFSSEFNKFVRIVLLEDEETIHTAFFDRNFKI